MTIKGENDGNVVSFRCSTTLQAQAEKEAARRGINKSQFLRDIVKAAVGEPVEERAGPSDGRLWKAYTAMRRSANPRGRLALTRGKTLCSEVTGIPKADIGTAVFGPLQAEEFIEVKPGWKDGWIQLADPPDESLFQHHEADDAEAEA